MNMTWGFCSDCSWPEALYREKNVSAKRLADTNVNL